MSEGPAGAQLCGALRPVRRGCGAGLCREQNPPRRHLGGSLCKCTSFVACVCRLCSQLFRGGVQGSLFLGGWFRGSGVAGSGVTVSEGLRCDIIVIIIVQAQHLLVFFAIVRNPRSYHSTDTNFYHNLDHPIVKGPQALHFTPKFTLQMAHVSSLTPPELL